MSEHLQVKLRQYHTYRRECLHREPLDQLRSTLLAGKPTACRYLIYYHSSDGQGNRLLSLVSSFAYALLTDRVFLLSSKSGPAAVLCEPFEHGESWVLFGREEKLEEHHAQVLGLKVAKEWREELSGNVTEVLVASLNAALVHNLSEAVTGNMSAVRVSVGHDVTHAAMGVKLPPINTTSAASPALASALASPAAAPATSPETQMPDASEATNASNSTSYDHVHIVRLTIDEKQNNGDKAGVDRAIVDIYTLALFSDALVISEVSTFGYLCASLFGVPRTTFISAMCKRAPPEPCLHFPPGNERCPDGQAQELEQVLAQDPHVPLMHCVDVSNGLTLKPLQGWE
ncbi:unnamed protein product [Closterium sp. Yama58-4]|nr:unnamed protein product [Closterium sp. Yama58-4]